MELVSNSMQEKIKLSSVYPPGLSETSLHKLVDVIKFKKKRLAVEGLFFQSIYKCKNYSFKAFKNAGYERQRSIEGR